MRVICLCDFPQCVCVSVCVSLYRYLSVFPSLVRGWTHTHAHTHTCTHRPIEKPYPQITLQLLSSVSKNISNYCFKCSSITECQVSSVTRHTHPTCTQIACVCVCVCRVCEEGWMKPWALIDCETQEFNWKHASELRIPLNNITKWCDAASIFIFPSSQEGQRSDCAWRIQHLAWANITGDVIQYDNLILYNQKMGSAQMWRRSNLRGNNCVFFSHSLISKLSGVHWG